jgi:hypothetical protein
MCAVLSNNSTEAERPIGEIVAAGRAVERDEELV